MPPARVLAVAEKPSVAKEVSRVLSGGSARMSQGRSPYNKVFEFEMQLRGAHVTMVFTSVTGHLMEMDFPMAYRKWRSCAEESLFGLPVSKDVREANKLVKENLVFLARSCDRLMLWLDCDREGENIAYEVIDVCCRARPSLRQQVSRAHFSSLNPGELRNAVQSARAPDENKTKAVDARQEIDLRVGAAFTRFQTMLLGDRFDFQGHERDDGKGPLLSYGPCQFPTLGFLVERQWEIDAHDPEDFWAIRATYAPPPDQQGARAPPPVRFSWQRGRVYDHLTAVMLFELCVENPTATVTRVDEKDERRFPPHPLNTVALTKLASMHFRIGGKKCMDEAERLYQQGYISYPRTETNTFSPDTDLMSMVNGLGGSGAPWAGYAQGLANGRFIFPRGGNDTDNAHPPIHPVRFDAPTGQGREAMQIYELVCRHFLACCSPPALGARTTVEVDIASERFTARALMIHDRSFLEVYTYMRWSDSTMPALAVGDTFQPTELTLDEGSTHPPPLLSEADLISAMDTNKIGTDATMHAHIDTVLQRKYAERDHNGRMRPTQLGMALVQAYAALDLQLWKPFLRAQMEKDLNDVAAGLKNKEQMCAMAIDSLKNAFQKAKKGSKELVDAVGKVFQPKIGRDGGDDDPTGGSGAVHVGDCRQCGMPMSFKRTQAGVPMVGCSGYPQCRNTIWLSSLATAIEVTDQKCKHCATPRAGRPGREAFMFRMQFPRRVLPVQYRDETEYVDCVLCQSKLRELCELIGTGSRGGGGGSGGGGSRAPSEGGGRKGRAGGGRTGGGRAPGGRGSGGRGAPGGGGGNCYKCGESGHWANACPNQGGGGGSGLGRGRGRTGGRGGARGGGPPRGPGQFASAAGGGGATATCFVCGEPGHFATNCPHRNE